MFLNRLIPLKGGDNGDTFRYHRNFTTFIEGNKGADTFGSITALPMALLVRQVTTRSHSALHSSVV